MPGKSKKGVRIHLRPAGVMLVCFTIALGIVAVNTANNILFLLTGFLLAVLSASGMCAYMNLKGIEVQTRLPPLGAVGAPAPIEVTLFNRLPFPAFLLEVILGEERRQLGLIGPREHRALLLPWMPGRRGLQPLPPLLLASYHPFAFIWRATVFMLAPLWVAPSPKAQSARLASFFEETGEREKGHGPEWHALRPYRPGEGLSRVVWRRVDWEREKRRVGPQVFPARELAQDDLPKAVIDWFDPALGKLDPEARLSCMRFLLDAAKLEGISWNLILPTKQVSGAGEARYAQGLLALAQAEPLPASCPHDLPPKPWGAIGRSPCLDPLGAVVACLLGGMVAALVYQVIPASVLVLWVLSGALALWASARGSAISGIIVAIVALAGLVGAMPAVSEGWTSLGVSMAMALLSAKTLEMRGLRDSYQAVALGLLGVGGAAMFRNDPFLGGALVLAFFVSALLLWWQPVLAWGKKKLSFAGMLVFPLFFLLLLPLTAFFFLLLPRTDVPLWHLGPQDKALSGFSPVVSPGSVSQVVLSDEVAFRAKVYPAPPQEDLYWKGAVLWVTDGLSWRPEAFPRGGKKIFQGNKDIVQEVVLTPGESGYLFSLAEPRWAESKAQIHLRPDGTLTLLDQSLPVIRYRVVSQKAQSLLDNHALDMALALPKGLDPRIMELARRFQAISDPKARALAIVDFLRSPPFRYSLVVPGKAKEDAVLQFLFETKSGYCELFASSLALLLRLNDIPARLVAGYHGGEYNALGDYWVVRQSMAHAWVEAYLHGQWLRLDATPAMPPSEDTSPHAAPARQQNIARLSQARSVLDWVSWRWQGFVVDFDLRRQRDLWRGLGEAAQKVAASPAPGHLPSKKSVFVLIFSLCAPIIGYLLWQAARRRRPVALPLFRELARKRLERASPRGLAAKSAGAEASLWSYWRKRAPKSAVSLKAAYESQRYGPAPDESGDRALKAAIACAREEMEHMVKGDTHAYL